MRRSIMRKIAAVLAMAMVLSTVAQGTPVYAAEPDVINPDDVVTREAEAALVIDENLVSEETLEILGTADQIITDAEASVENKVSATDGMGAVFRRAACEYMKYRLPADFAKEFLAELDFFNRAEEVRNFFSQIQSIQKDLSEIDETVIRINDLIEDIRVLQQDATDIAAEVNELLLLKEPDKKQKKLLEDSTDALLGTKKSIMGAVEHILDSSGVYEKLAESVCTYLRGLADEWLSNNVSQNIKDIVLGEIDSLITYSGGNGDVYGIERNKDC